MPRFDIVMGLVGSTLTGPLMFIFPPLFFLKLCHSKANLSKDDDLTMSVSYTSKKQNGVYLQNGDATLPILRNALETKYKTFVNSYDELFGQGLDRYNIKWYDLLLALVVMLMGVTATVVATFSSWSDAVNSATFSAPCLINVTAAARSFLEITKKD